MYIIVFNKITRPTYNLYLAKLSSLCSFFLHNLFFQRISQISESSFRRSFLSRQIFLILLLSILSLTSYSSQALISKTSNVIHGSVPYLTFDGGRTRVSNTEDLLGISLSDETKYTPSINNSSLTNPIELPTAIKSFADIGVMVPADVDSISLNSLIGEPYNYWGDDDGDDGVTATGNLYLSITDRDNNPVIRNEMITICKAPYKMVLKTDGGTLATLYGVPKKSDFIASDVTYFISPKGNPVVCFAKPNLEYGSLASYGHYFGGPATMWNEQKGFITQSNDPSSYNLNFPTTGANNLYFDLDIGGIYQALYWEPVTHNDITATMTSISDTSVRVTLTGPTKNTAKTSLISLPQIFELVGKDSSGNSVIKYGFQLNQWFVTLNQERINYRRTESLCGDLGYRIPQIKDLTNANCDGKIPDQSFCQGAIGAIPASTNGWYQRIIGAGFFSEWGYMGQYKGARFVQHDDRLNFYWTSDIPNGNRKPYAVNSHTGYIFRYAEMGETYGICVTP